MFIKLNRKSRAQTTAEYAILIGLVIAAAVAMQIWVKRNLQARMHEAVGYMARTTGDANATLGLGKTTQYEPYYLSSNFTVGRTTNTLLNYLQGNVVASDTSRVTRELGGFQEYANVANAD